MTFTYSRGVDVMSDRFPNNLNLFSRISAVLMLWILMSSTSLASPALTAKSGKLDLNPWNFQTGELLLEGQWLFYPQQLVFPKDLDRVIQDNTTRSIEVPGPWNQFELSDGQAFGSYGYGSYLLHLTGLPLQSSLALKFNQASSNYRLFWVPKGVLVDQPLLENGQVGQDQLSSVPQFREYVAQLPRDHPNGEAWIIVQVSNFHWVHGGLFFAPTLGESKASFSGFQSRFITSVITSGMLLMLVLYNISIYLRQREETTALWLALASFISFLSNTTYFTPFFYEIFNPSFETHRLYRYLQYSGSVVAVACFNEMFRANFPRQASRLVRWYCFLVVILFHAVHFIYSYGPPVALMRTQQLLALLIPPVVLPQMFRAYRDREESAGLAFWGFVILFGANLSDLFRIFRITNTPSLVPYGYVCLSFVLSQVHANRFANLFHKTLALGAKSDQLNRELQTKNAEVHDLNANLEIKVAQRTAEINSLLQHIPQGILTIGEGGIIDPNYSAHLPQILGRIDIGGKSFKELILDHTELGRDRIDQAWQSILASLNAIALNFEVNLDNLPTEFCYQGPQPVILKCTWNIEVDQSNIVRHILVTLLDISAEVEARIELDAKNREFNIVRQLIEIGSTKSKQFFSSGHQLLNENERLIAEDEIDKDSIRVLLVNMHTLKGAARTLQLLEMSEVFHSVEHYYSEIMKSDTAIDRLKLEQDHRRALDIFDRYMAFNRNVLGRTEDDGKLAINRNLLEKNVQILQTLIQSNSLESALKKAVQESCDQLTQIIFLPLPQLLDEVMKQAGRIAKDLQKEEPLVTIDSEALLMNYRNEIAIKNAFIHLLRNSLDHGIEAPDIRRSKGKDSRGHIKVIAKNIRGEVAIHFEDDGVGLAIGHLREKGLAMSLIHAHSSLEEICELIFHQGISTAKTMSQISGRGIGMDAVRRFIEGEGGRVELHLGPCLDAVNELYNFHFVISLPNRTTTLT